MISVVVVYNNQSVLETFLQPSLAAQAQRFEFIPVDNQGGAFTSAAAALNHGASRATGDYLFFAHQDIRFEPHDWLESAERYLRALDAPGIAGVAGTIPADGGRSHLILSNIEDSDPPQRSGHVFLENPREVETVDECAFFVPRDVFSSVRFDERVCPGWHLYAVDYSLSVREAGLKAYALPLPLYHRSGGAIVRFMGVSSYESAYFQTLRRLLRKHSSNWSRIHTTCGTWTTDQPLVFQRFPPAVVRRSVFAWLRARLTS